MFGMNSREGNEAVRSLLEDVYGIEDPVEASEALRLGLSIISLEYSEVATLRVREAIQTVMDCQYEGVLV